VHTSSSRLIIDVKWQSKLGFHVYNRFAQADSIIPAAGNSAAWDRYVYGLNNPLFYTDPDGHKPRPPQPQSDGGFISIGIAISRGFGRNDFWTGSLDLVWNNKGQVALFSSPLVDHGAVDATIPVVSNTEQCSAPCLVDKTPKFMTPGASVSFIEGDIKGEDFSNDVNAYSGPFTVASENLGDEGISIAFEEFTSVDPKSGVPDFQTTGAGFGLSAGWGAVPLLGGGIYTVDSRRRLPIEKNN
jgi:hypothetical protein